MRLQTVWRLLANHRAARPLATFTLLATIALTACTGPATSTDQSPGAASSGGPRTLRLAFIDEPEDISGGSGRANREQGSIFHAGLTYWDPAGNLQPQLAVKVPSLADGDWQTFPDGKMEVTWKLKPGLTWHDGRPLTSEDFAFAGQLLRDEATPRSVPPLMRRVSEIAIPDPQTVVMRFNRTYVLANDGSRHQLPPIPSHLLNDAYAQVGAQALANNPYWSTEFVGAGPYRMVSRSLGSQIEGAAFDDYVLGRPKIDRIIIRYIFDVNALYANLLSGDIDMAPFGSLEPVNASDLKKQWETAGKGSVIAAPSRLRQSQMQYRDSTLPHATDPRVRQAMLHLIDRQAIVDNVLYGLTSVADLPALPDAPVYPILQRRGAAAYRFDRAQGERLLEAAGWGRGPDGVRRNSAGAILKYNQAITGRPDLPEALIIADSLKAGGFSSEVNIIEDGATDANERRAKADGILRSAQLDASYWERFLTSQISTEQSRWRGSNTGGYTNPTFDRMVEDWLVTLDPAARTEKSADLIKFLWDEVAYLPMYYNVDIAAYRQGLAGPKAPAAVTGHTSSDIHTWTLE